MNTDVTIAPSPDEPKRLTDKEVFEGLKGAILGLATIGEELALRGGEASKARKEKTPTEDEMRRDGNNAFLCGLLGASLECLDAVRESMMDTYGLRPGIDEMLAEMAREFGFALTDTLDEEDE